MEEISVKERFLGVMKEFCHQAGIAELELDQDQNCNITFNDDIIVNIHYNLDSDTVFTYALVGIFGTQFNREELLRRMLNDNFFWEKSRGFTLALKDDTDEMVVLDRRHASWFLDADALAVYLENCADTIQEWRELLEIPEEELDNEAAFLNDFRGDVSAMDGENGFVRFDG